MSSVIDGILSSQFMIHCDLGDLLSIIWLLSLSLTFGLAILVFSGQKREYPALTVEKWLHLSVGRQFAKTLVLLAAPILLVCALFGLIVGICLAVEEGFRKRKH